MPARPAIAVRWMTALVEPPSASSTRSAFSTDFALTMRSGVSFEPISLTAAAPVASAARRRSACTAGIAAVPGRHHAERFGEAGHGRGGAHHRAGAGGDRELAFDLGNLVGIDLAGAIARPEAAAIGAGAEPLAAMAAGHHRAGDQRDGRPVGGHRAHQLRRHGLVAAAHQHHRVHRLRADHFLGVDRHQVAVFQAGRREEHFAERDGRKLQRQRAGRQHAAFHRCQAAPGNGGGNC